MTDRDSRGDETIDDAVAGDASQEPEDVAGPAPRPRRSWRWWLARAVVGLAVLLLVLTLTMLALYQYGTMWPPSAEAQASYDQLVAQGVVPPEEASPGFRIPIPGCVCHAADDDLAQKAPGHVPDVTLVMAHRYRTINQCFSAGCHGGEGEATEGPVQGEPLNQSPTQAQ